MLGACWVTVALFAASTDVAGAMHGVLTGEATSVAAQRALNETMGWSAGTGTGVLVSGRRVRVRDLDPGELREELERPVPFLHYFEVNGEGPEPLRITVPVPVGTGEIEVHRRLEPGIFLRISEPVTRRGGHASFEARWPGRFVVRETDEFSAPDTKGFFAPGLLASLDTALRTRWNLKPIAPETIAGPVPVVLIHGAETNRWGDFRHWAEFSPEAAAFRAQFQVWDFNHELVGINAAVGYDPDCPYFEDSIAATLDRFIREASLFGVEEAGGRWFFPSGGFALMGHSHGALKARAFLVNFPEQAVRCFAAISISGDNTGSPWATPEWVRHTLSRLALTPARLLERLLAVGYAGYYGLDSQSNLDAGWANLDARGGGGMPYTSYRTWMPGAGLSRRWLSPRDSMLTGARELPEYPNDEDFDPPELLPNYCGGIDLITPQERGGLWLDRHFIYANYIETGKGWREILLESGSGMRPAARNVFENVGLRVANQMFAIVQARNADWPMGAYQFGDGFVPLQSQLALDGREQRPIFKTARIFGWEHPVRPLEPDMDVINAHTLADPDRIRILPGWSHLDTITGRYDRRSGHSTLFSMIAEDLLSVLPR